MTGLLDWFSRFFSTTGFMPHGMCIAWTPKLLWSMVGADVLIAASYYSIPAALYFATRWRPDPRYNRILLMFGAFIFACGTTHLIDVVTVWYPQYWLDAGAKVATAGISAATAVVLWPLVREAGDYVKQSERQAVELADTNQLLRDLAAKNREINDFAHLASHDLQEPLRTVATASKLIRDRYGDRLDDVGSKSIELMAEATSRMEQLINDLLDHSRIGASPSFESVSCDELVEAVRRDLSASIEACGGRVEADPLPTVTGHPSELRVLFQNLVGNALKFRDPERPPVVRISAERSDGAWRFQVADNGIGISADHRRRIFQIFQRLHPRQDYPGTGIGLSHCRKIVEVHGGQIWVESALGEGSTFYFTLSDRR